MSDVKNRDIVWSQIDSISGEAANMLSLMSMIKWLLHLAQKEQMLHF